MPRPLPAALLAAALLLGGCASPADQPTGPAVQPASPAVQAASPADGHGAVEGAAEVAEPQLALITVDPSGTVQQLDLLEGTGTEVGTVDPPTATSTDGRYVAIDGGSGVTVVDSGRWTWDHGDHFHHYLAAPRVIGHVPGEGPATVAWTASSTSGSTGIFFAGSGTAVLLDNAALADGEVVERWREETTPHDGLVVPVGSAALVTVVEEGQVTGLAVRDEEGNPGDAIGCPAASGTITTRVGAVVGCEDGAVLAVPDADGPVLTHLPLPADATAPAPTAFDNREGRPTVAGLAGPEGRDGIWLLDTREQTWTLLPSPAPLRHVTAVDDEAGHLLALDADGRVLVLEDRSGAVMATTDPLLPRTVDDPAAVAGVRLVADQQRAYLNAPLEQALLEIDFADGGRIARTFPTTGVPAEMARVGR